MYKLTLKLILAVIITASTLTAFAQPFFMDNNNNKNSQPSGPVIPPPNPVMTPDQFKTKVDTQSKENTNKLNQQISQELSQVKQPSSQPPTQPTNDFSSLNNQSAPTNSSSPDQGQQLFGTTTGLPNPHPVSPVQRQQQAPQNNTYTGFGTGNNQGTTNSTGSSNSGGWNIKY